MPFSEKMPTVGENQNQKFLLDFSKSHGAEVTIHHPGEVLPPPEKLKPGVNPMIVEMLTDYLSGPIITDEFGAKHEQRREFVDQVKLNNTKAYQWLEANRLRFNNMFGLSMIGILDAHKTIDQHLLARLNDQLPKSAEEFSALPDDEQRVSKVKVITQTANEIYQSLIES